MQTASHQPLLQLLWDAWKAYARRATGYQTQVVLNAAYFLVLGPCAVAARALGAGLLDLGRRPRASYWLQRKTTNGTLDDLERQF